MLNETLKTLRKQKGYSQEEVASRLNVVRQTISKWEKGLSVPDAEALMRLAELYEISVSDLLGMPPQKDADEAAPPDMREIAEQLSRINEQLAVRNRRSARIWKTAVGVLLGWILLRLILTVLSFAAFSIVQPGKPTGIITTEEFTESAEDTLSSP